MDNTEEPGHEYFMHRCIALGKISRKNGESPVGSIIVRRQKIIGEGMEKSRQERDITFHAEIEAIREAVRHLQSQDLSDCILYTTHEPCIMCSYVIRHTKIKTVVSGISSGEVGGVSSQLPILSDTTIKKWNRPPEYIPGILGKECREL